MTPLDLMFVGSVYGKIVEIIPQIKRDIALFIACQFALESNYGRSRLAMVNNNFCGMRNPLVRPSTSLISGLSGESLEFARYSSLESCIIDYWLCVSYHQPMVRDFESIDSYKRFMKWYCPEMDYFDKITKIFNQLKQQNYE